MATPPPSETDDEARMTLLTEALRAGPASPEWSRAVAALGDRGPAVADEFQTLLEARRHLESGRRYREVRGGPVFTRRVMDGVDAIAGGRDRRRVTPAALIIGSGVVVIMLALAGMGAWLLRSGTPAGENLSALYFNTVAAAATFDGPLPPGWRQIGRLQLDPAHGLRTTLAATQSISPTASRDILGGGLVTTRGLPVYRPMAVEAVFTFGKVADDVVPELFVTDDPHFSRDRATSPHELAWLVRGGRVHVALPDGRFAGDTAKVAERSRQSVRIVVGRDKARVVVNDQVLYDGPGGLGTGDRFAGVRLLRRGDATGEVRVDSIQVLQP